MKSNTYKAKVDGNWFFLIGVFISAVMILIGNTSNTESNEYWIGVVAVAIIGSILYYLATRSSYTLTEDRLVIKFFMYTNELPYKYIQHIKKANYPSAGRKAAWAKEGITIYYNQGSMLFIAPVDRSRFINDIGSRAEHVQVIDK